LSTAKVSKGTYLALDTFARIHIGPTPKEI
jgi:hypothetical protein